MSDETETSVSVEQAVEDIRVELRELEHELLHEGKADFELGKAVKSARRELDTPGAVSALSAAGVGVS